MIVKFRSPTMSVVRRLLVVQYHQHQQLSKFSRNATVLEQKPGPKSFKTLRNWEYENNSLYGPKLSKEKVMKYAQKKLSERSARNDIIRNTRGKQLQNDIKISKKQSIGSMDRILNFPLFNAGSNMQLSSDEFAKLPYNRYVENALNGYTPSVTKIISETMSEESKQVLERWKANMILELGEEGFKKFQQETFARGHRIHSCIEQYLQDLDVDVGASIEGYWTSLHDVLDDISEAALIEQKVAHPLLKYSGYFDCVAKFKDTLCLIDWKTSKKQKATLRYTYDNPLQIAAYLGAYNFDPTFKDLKKVENTLIVVAYEDGRPAHAHFLSREKCEYYWQEWLKRLHQFWSTRLVDQHM